MYEGSLSQGKYSSELSDFPGSEMKEVIESNLKYFGKQGEWLRTRTKRTSEAIHC